MTDSTNLRVAPSELASAAACLSEEDVVAFAMGRLEVRRLSPVHEHLDHCAGCQYLVSEGVHALTSAVTRRASGSGSSFAATDRDFTNSTTTFQVGSLVGGRYRVRRFIIDGGMGEVYEAFDCDLQEWVALKTVKSTVSDHPRAVRWLKGEVQLARRVSHSNVCRIYDFGTHTMPETGAVISFLTMEFVEGDTLGVRLRSGGALPVSEARRLARQLLLGLIAAHEAGVLHRDFKSDNVMLRKDARDRNSAVILDFGLARPLDGEAKSNSAALVGTFGYIAPEQLEGKPHTRASDVYSFGVVWYEMLTGELPFGDDGCASLGALPPSSRNPLVPRELDAVVLKCIRRAPKDRFKSGEEVLRALDAIRPPGIRVRTPIAIAAVAALCTLVIYFSAFERARPPRARVVALHAALAPPLAVPGPASASPSAAGVAPLASEKARPVSRAVPARTRRAGPTAPSVALAPALPGRAPEATLIAAPAESELPTPQKIPRPKHEIPDWEPL